MKLSTPPTTQTESERPTEPPDWLATVPETRKIPDPMMAPTTMNPRSRAFRVRVRSAGTGGLGRVGHAAPLAPEEVDRHAQQRAADAVEPLLGVGPYGVDHDGDGGEHEQDRGDGIARHPV